jgi:hypothetical protein
MACPYITLSGDYKLVSIIEVSKTNVKLEDLLYFKKLNCLSPEVEPRSLYSCHLQHNNDMSMFLLDFPTMVHGTMTRGTQHSVCTYSQCIVQDINKASAWIRPKHVLHLHIFLFDNIYCGAWTAPGQEISHSLPTGIQGTHTQQAGPRIR